MEVKLSRELHGLAVVSLLGLIVLCVGWEWRWAPLHPHGSLMVLKAVPLLFAVRGVLKGSLYTMQWVSMLSLLYLMEGVVRAWSDLSPVSAALAGLEIILSLGLYLGAILYVRPAKKAARHG
ncbi:MAG TPA: DUF2069 domain-containing protein [Castellaniella sp.]|uniref:DUF2069 domain-containing protein n=1 Tax=Castellaniella sp. TaxID=1955812 RepID=UPI002F1701B7